MDATGVTGTKIQWLFLYYKFSCLLLAPKMLAAKNHQLNDLRLLLFSFPCSLCCNTLKYLEMKGEMVQLKYTLHKKWSFPLRILSVNVTKSAVSCEFGNSYWRNPKWKTSFVVQWNFLIRESCSTAFYSQYSQITFFTLRFANMSDFHGASHLVKLHSCVSAPRLP